MVITGLNHVVSERMFIVVSVVLAISILTSIFAIKVGPVAVFAAIASLPILGFTFREPTEADLGLLGMFLIMAVRRLTAPQPIKVTWLKRRQILLNRLLFDRDIRDKELWMSPVEDCSLSKTGMISKSLEAL
jgi:hypothetical protein